MPAASRLFRRTAPYPRLSALAALAGDGPVADIVAVEHAVPANLLGQAVGLLLGIGDAGTDGGGAQHAAAGGDDLAVLQRSEERRVGKECISRWAEAREE